MGMSVSKLVKLVAPETKKHVFQYMLSELRATEADKTWIQRVLPEIFLTNQVLSS